MNVHFNGFADETGQSSPGLIPDICSDRSPGNSPSQSNKMTAPGGSFRFIKERESRFPCNHI